MLPLSDLTESLVRPESQLLVLTMPPTRRDKPLLILCCMRGWTKLITEEPNDEEARTWDLGLVSEGRRNWVKPS